ncbi:MAG: cytochrome c oxidase subunit 4 [Actinomycetota bacterium]|nr:cytochrome c oxidase subunit 4 [Actinomycetota bacterium]
MRSDGVPELAGMRIEARIFLGIAAFLALLAVVYVLGAYEPAGTAMLALAAAMGLVIGGYLAVQARRWADPASRGEEDAPQPAPAAAEAYLPGSSIWPFGLGMGLVLMLNGFALGAWAVLPGAGIATACTFGYARQSRRRD